MDDHFTQTTERTQQQHLQDKTALFNCSTHSILPDFTFSHAEFPYGYRYIYIREHYSEQVPCTQCTQHIQATDFEPGRVQQNSQQLKMESSNMEALPCFNYSAETTPQMETSRKGPGADSIQNGKGTTVTSSQATPMDPIQSPTRECISTMNVHSQDSHSSKTD